MTCCAEVRCGFVAGAWDLDDVLVVLGTSWGDLEVVDRGVGDAVQRFRVDPRLGQRLEPAMRGDDQPAERLGNR
jgi:hypothetical protein